MSERIRIRTVIESPFGTRPDGTRCTPLEIARNERYLDRCIRDSIDRGEAPYASHGFFTKPGRLDDNKPEQRRQGIEAGLEWGAVAQRCAVYDDHDVTAGMAEGIARHRARGLEIEYRRIGAEPDVAIPPQSGAAAEAIGYVLNRIQIDPNVGYYCGVGTQVFYLLCKAESELTGRPLADVEAARRRNLTPEHREQRPDVIVLRKQIEAIEAGL